MIRIHGHSDCKHANCAAILNNIKGKKTFREKLIEKIEFKHH